jgi:hypothetical protein
MDAIVYRCEKADQVYNMIKVSTSSGDIGFVYLESLLSLSSYKLRNDSIARFTKTPPLTYKNLIGSVSGIFILPPELQQSWPFNYINQVKFGYQYAVQILINSYNDNYKYLMFCKLGAKDSIKEVFDIVPIDLSKYKKETTIWFGQCRCGSPAGECSDIIALYRYYNGIPNPQNLISPEKSWLPNIETKKIEEVTDGTVKCGLYSHDESEGP